MTARTCSTWPANGAVGPWPACCSGRPPGSAGRATNPSAGTRRPASAAWARSPTTRASWSCPGWSFPVGQPPLECDRRRVAQDWQRKYSHPVFLLETFVATRRSRACVTAPPTGPASARPPGAPARTSPRSRRRRPRRCGSIPCVPMGGPACSPRDPPPGTPPAGAHPARGAGRTLSAPRTAGGRSE